MISFILEWTLRSSALGVIVWMLLKALRIKNPRVERGAWRAVLVSSLLMPLLMKAADLSPVSNVTFNVKPVGMVLVPAQEISASWLSNALLISVALVSAALTLRHAWAIGQWRRTRRLATPMSFEMENDLDIRASSKVSSPVTVFSTVLVPLDFANWPPAARQLAIAHERAHIDSKDFYVQWLAQLHSNLLWFNPFAWWLASRLSLLSEHVSDDAATEHAEERTEYARLLLGLVQRSGVGSPVVPMVKASSLAPRIERILREPPPARIRRSTSLLLACALLPIVSTVAAVQTASDIVLPRSNPQTPLSIPVYPPVSRNSGEHGTVVLKLHVLEDGSIADAMIDKSSGYPALDYAAMYESFRWRLQPGTVDGEPARMWGRFAVTFKLDQDESAATRL